jgi:nucleotide-binding universal stress UspA family protein
MIVVGTRGRTGLAKMFIGSVAERIFRNALCPVLTVGPHSPAPVNREQGVKRILYATDFTPQSLYAAQYAISMAQQFQAHLTLMHVVPEPDGGVLDEQCVPAAEGRLRQLMSVDHPVEFEAQCVVASGPPPTRILEVAEKDKSELIVLGVTQPGDMTLAGRRWTNASEITGKAPCPVLTVRKPEAVA